MALAVIDLGTNTFHLLIVDVNADGSFKERYRERKFIQLAENGIEKIGEAPFERGLQAMKAFSEVIKKYPVEKLIASGTAALRRASNGQAFVNQVKADCDISIQIISGDREAELITKGIRKAVPPQETPILIMDIGGGSVEFIIATKKKILWAQSFQIGVAILYNQFHKSEPISKTEAGELKQHINKTLYPLWEALADNPASRLIGASGTFDVLELMLEKSGNHLYSDLKSKDVLPICRYVSTLNLDERYLAQNIPDQRAKLMVVALLLIQVILKKTGIREITVSAYAMKEGILSELISS